MRNTSRLAYNSAHKQDYAGIGIVNRNGRNPFLSIDLDGTGADGQVGICDSISQLMVGARLARLILIIHLALREWGSWRYCI